VDGEPVELSAVLKRAELEMLAEPWLARVLALVDSALAQAPFEPSALDDVLLVGGMSRMPALQGRVALAAQHKPSRRVHADEALVRGLAWLGNPAAGANYSVAETLLLPLRVARGHASIEVFGAGTVWPVRRAINLHSEGENATRVHLFQGEGMRIEDGDYLASLTLRGRGDNCALQLELDADGRLRASARSASTGEAVQCELRTDESLAVIARELSA
jgi:molecular chaperone DnaK